MSVTKSPSFRAFKAQLREQFISQKVADEAREILDSHEWICADQRETLEMFARQQAQLTWFLYGWNAAASHFTEDK